MNHPAAARYIAGVASRWAGVDPDKPKRGERAIIERFGENVILAWEIMVDELRTLNTEKETKDAA